MKKNLLFTVTLLAGFTFLAAQDIVFSDDFESYADDANLADAGYETWEGGAVVSDVTVDGGTAVSGDKFAVLQPSANNFYFRKEVNVIEGRNYTFEATTKSPDAKNHRIGYILGNDAAVVAPVVGATDWTNSTLTFTPATGQTSVVLYLYSYPNFNVHLDDFILTVEASAVTATLSALSIDVGTLVPVFIENTFDYTATLPAGTTVTPTVTATAAETGATVDIVNAADVTSATEADRTSTVTVTGEDGTTINVYFILFDVASSDDASLSNLSLSLGTLDPAFDAATMAYTAVLPYGTAVAPTVTATPTNAGATVDVTDATDVTSAVEADRTTAVVVTAEDGTTTKTYHIVFSVIDDTPWAYIPVFADDFEGYENGFNLADTGYIMWEGGATVVDVEVDGGRVANSGTKYAHLSPSANNYYFRRPLDLEEGIDYVFELFTRSPGAKNHRAVAKIGERSIQGPLQSDTVWTKTSIEFTVGAGETSAIFWIYSFPVSRVDLDDFGIYKKVDGSGTLSALSIDVGTLDPEFEQFTFDYMAELPAGTTTIPAVSASAFEEDATVNITDATDVNSDNAADRTTTIEVISGDGETTNTYTVEFSMVVSVAERLSSRFGMYPNPATEDLFISNAEIIRSVSIVTMAGQEIIRKTASGEATLQLDVSGLEPGVYLISIVDAGQNRYTDRLIRR